jgi:glycosyltransferase involved in cell wall biosynthesis
MTFQILIPTMPHRQHMLAALFDIILPQIQRHAPRVTYLTDDGPGTIGVKRQRMLEAATADYVAFIDDDDRVAPDYLDRILPLLATGPDCVGISVYVTIDGRPWQPSPIFLHSLQYRDNTAWSGDTRTPHHLCPMRRELALRARFPDMSWGEDYRFALGVLPHLHTEAWAGPEPIYFYDYRTGKPTDPPPA